MREMSKWCEEVMREEEEEEQEDTNVHAVTKVWSLASQDLIHCFLFGSQEIGEYVKDKEKKYKIFGS